MATLLRDSPAAARAAELRYVVNDEPGYRRIKRGRGFVYLTPEDVPVTEKRVLERIARLAIPPAWQAVWICRGSEGHIQATGRDARGRKQYRYHPRWRKIRDHAKYEDVIAFAQRLPQLRKRLKKDISHPHLNKQKVLATVVRLMENTSIRVGNDCYADANGSYGLTTLLDQHAHIDGGHVEFRFRGKGGKPYRASVRDRKLARIVERCRDIPGQRLFQYVDEDGSYRPITSSDVNEYIKHAMGFPFTAKGFRTWAGTVGAALHFYASAPQRTLPETRRCVSRAYEEVSKLLGNTPAICKKCYVHPAVVEAFTAGSLHRTFKRCLAEARRRPRAGLSPEESAAIALLKRLDRARRIAAPAPRRSGGRRIQRPKWVERSAA
jgi:DNA topoisomerase I